MFTWRLVQGQGGVLNVTVSACPVDATMVLSGTVSDGLNGAALLLFTPEWAASGPPQLVVTLTPTQTSALPPGGYVVQVGLASGGGALAFGTLEIIPGPGNVPLFDVLTTPGRVLLMDPTVRNSADRVAILPIALRAASQLIRRVAARRFTRGDYTEYHVPSLDGQIRLDEFPVNRIIRASRRLDTAITITADASTYQTAYADFSTQDGAFDDPDNLIYTGINLVGVSDGVQSTTAILFSATPTLADLADAVSSVSGWKATTGGYGRWATSELYCDGTSQGAIGDGVQLRVFAEDVSDSYLDRKTGMLGVRYGRYIDDFGPRWGPAWTDYADYGFPTGDDVVRVTYNAGFTTIPDAIQDATVLMSRLMMDRMQLDFTLKKESIGEYSYELNDKLMGMTVPDSIRGMIGPYIGYRA
jgi:hypothetical protein